MFLQQGFPMALVSATMLVPEVFELPKFHSPWRMLIPGNGITVALIASKVHEGLNALAGLRIEVLPSVLNPSMKVRGPKLNPEQPMGEVRPIVAPSHVDGLKVVVLEIVWEEVTSDEAP